MHLALGIETEVETVRETNSKTALELETETYK